MDEEGKKEEQEETITFIKDDKVIYGVLNYDGNDMMAVISGYGLNVSFNMRLINSLADAENCANSIADVFYELLMEQLIAEKPNIKNEGKRT